jgi:hypothetical protein
MPSARFAAVVLALLLLAFPTARSGAEEAGCAKASADCQHDSLEPSYEPRPPQEPEVYTTEYLFALTRAVAGSQMVPAVQVLVFLFTVPTDAVLLPVEAIAGFFPGD